MSRSTALLPLMVMSACMLMAAPARAALWSLSGDFSTASNPNGQWSYGRSLGTAASEVGIGSWVNNWVGDNGTTWDQGFQAWSYYTNISASATAKALQTSSFNWNGMAGTVAPGTVVMWTSSDRDTWARWQVPVGGGKYDVSVTYGGLGSPAKFTAAVVEVYKISGGSFSQLWSSYIDEVNTSRTYTASRLSLAAGDSLEFLVSRNDRNGVNHYYVYDRPTYSTVDATIAAVPEPGVLAMLGMGVGCFGCAVRRRPRK